MGHLYRAPLAAPSGRQETPLLGASAARGAPSNTSLAKQVRISDISCCAIASSSPRSELIINIKCLHNIANYALAYIFTTWCTGAPTNKTAVRGRLPPHPPPIAPPLWFRKHVISPVCYWSDISLVRHIINPTKEERGRLKWWAFFYY